MVIVYVTVAARVLEVREQRARGLAYDQAIIASTVWPTISAAEISNYDDDKSTITAEVTVGETFLDTFLDRPQGAPLELRDHHQEQAITDVPSAKMPNSGASLGGIKMPEPSRADCRINAYRKGRPVGPYRSRFVR